MKKSGEDNGQTDQDNLKFALGGSALAMAGFALAANENDNTKPDNAEIQQSEQEPEPREESSSHNHNHDSNDALAANQSHSEAAAEAENNIVMEESDNVNVADVTEDVAIEDYTDDVVIEDFIPDDMPTVSVESDFYPDGVIDEFELVNTGHGLIDEGQVASEVFINDGMIPDSEILIADQFSDYQTGDSTGDIETFNEIV